MVTVARVYIFYKADMNPIQYCTYSSTHSVSHRKLRCFMTERPETTGELLYICLHIKIVKHTLGIVKKDDLTI
jgi:hypothetical protein